MHELLTVAERGTSRVFLAIIALGLLVAAWLYPSLPPEIPNHVNPSVAGDMPRWLWLAIHATLLLILVPLYVGLSREYPFWGLVWREHRVWYDSFFSLTAVVALWPILFQVLANAGMRVPEGIFWALVTVPFLTYSSALLGRSWAPLLWPPLPDDLRRLWSRAVHRTSKAYAVAAVTAGALFYWFEADAIWLVGLLWVLLWFHLSTRRKTMERRTAR